MTIGLRILIAGLGTATGIAIEKVVRDAAPKLKHKLEKRGLAPRRLASHYVRRPIVHAGRAIKGAARDLERRTWHVVKRVRA